MVFLSLQYMVLIWLGEAEFADNIILVHVLKKYIAPSLKYHTILYVKLRFMEKESCEKSRTQPRQDYQTVDSLAVNQLNSCLFFKHRNHIEINSQCGIICSYYSFSWYRSEVQGLCTISPDRNTPIFFWFCRLEG